MSKETKKSQAGIERIKEVMKTLEEEFGLATIKDNKIYFKFNQKQYRVRMPNTKEENEATDAKNKFKFKLLKDDNYLTREQLIELYKKKGIDIEELDKEMFELNLKVKDLMYKLATTPEGDTEAIENQKRKIEELKDRMYQISIKKSQLLEGSIEDRVEQFYTQYLTALCTEVEEGENNWKKVWKTYEDFENDNSDLTLKALSCMVKLLVGIRNDGQL